MRPMAEYLSTSADRAVSVDISRAPLLVRAIDGVGRRRASRAAPITPARRGGRSRPRGRPGRVRYRCHRFQAAGGTATAKLAADGADDGMSSFACDAGLAALQFTVQDDPGADAGANGQRNDVASRESAFSGLDDPGAQVW